MTEIKIPYVHAFRDRHGRMRYYVRRKGKKSASLPGLPGSKPFMEAYQAAIGNAAEPDKQSKGGERSLSALIASFYKSAGFKNLSPGSQKSYRHVLKHAEAKDGHRSAVDLPDEKARKIIEEIGGERPAMANLTRSVMRKLFAHAVKIKWRFSNPFVGIDAYKMGSHHTWTDKEIAAYQGEWPLGTRERVAFDLLFYTVQRVGDVAKMKRADMVKGRIHLVQEKTGFKMSIPVHEDLKRSLHAYGVKGQHLVGRLDGKPLNGDNLSKVIRKAADEAGLPASCVCHGIRKARLRMLAEMGASTKMLAAIAGHKSLKEVERYTEAADQDQLTDAAVALMTVANLGLK